MKSNNCTASVVTPAVTLRSKKSLAFRDAVDALALASARRAAFRNGDDSKKARRAAAALMAAHDALFAAADAADASLAVW